MSCQSANQAVIDLRALIGVKEELLNISLKYVLVL